jgi:hypothetical protein
MTTPARDWPGTIRTCIDGGAFAALGIPLNARNTTNVNEGLFA